MTVDIAPELLSDIQDLFNITFNKNKRIKELLDIVNDGKATYKEAHEFAVEVGKTLAEVYKNKISSDKLPNGRMYYNIADRVLRPTLENNHNIVAELAAKVQWILNVKAGLGIKAIKPDVNKDKIDGLVNIVSDSEKYDDVAHMLGEPVVNFTETVVDATVEANAEFQYNSGLSPKIRRTSTGKCCEWCNKIAGVFKYADIPDNIFKRHKRCRCLVEYEAGSDIKQKPHKKPKKPKKEKKEEKTGVTKKTKEEAKELEDNLSKMVKSSDKDVVEYESYKNIIGDSIGSLAEFRQMKYNKNNEIELLRKKVKVYYAIDQKDWTEEFKYKSKMAYDRFEKEKIHMSDHALSRLSRLDKPGYLKIEEKNIISILHGKPNYIDDGNNYVFFDLYYQIAIIKNKDTDDIVSIIRRKNPKETWKSV